MCSHFILPPTTRACTCVCTCSPSAFDKKGLLSVPVIRACLRCARLFYLQNVLADMLARDVLAYYTCRTCLQTCLQMMCSPIGPSQCAGRHTHERYPPDMMAGCANQAPFQPARQMRSKMCPPNALQMVLAKCAPKCARQLREMRGTQNAGTRILGKWVGK